MRERHTYNPNTKAIVSVAGDRIREKKVSHETGLQNNGNESKECGWRVSRINGRKNNM